jgi:ATP-dependent helicase/nuclease subunit B
MIARFDIKPIADILRDGYTVLVPNQRIRDSLLCAHAAQSVADTWFTPDINAVDVWLKNTWNRLAGLGQKPFAELRLMDSLEESLLWIDIVEQEQQKTALLNIEETAASAQQAYQLYRLWLDDGSASRQFPSASGIPELTLFASWSREFHKHCQQQQLVSLADGIHLLIRELSNGNIEHPDNIVAVNFFQPPPLYLKLLKSLVADWSKHHLQTADPLAKPPGICHTYTDLESEIRACAEWARGKVREQPDAHVAVIVADELKTRPVIERIFTDIFNPDAFVDLLSDRPLFNGIPLHSPLPDHKLIGDALLLLNVANPVQNTAEFCQILQSPSLLRANEELEARIQLEKYLRENLGSQCTVSQLLRIMSREEQPYFCPVLKEAILALVNQQRTQQADLSPREWLRSFTVQLESLGWPAPHSKQNHLQRELINCWQQVADCLAAHQPPGGTLSRSAAISRLRTLCQKTVPPLRFDSSRALSLYRLNDAAGLEFSHTWFLGFSDQAQPPAANPSPFLAHRLQREARIPGSHSEVQVEIAQQAFGIICDSTSGEIHASYHIAAGDERFRPSSLIGKFRHHGETVSTHQPLNSLATSSVSSIAMDTLRNDPPVPLRDGEQTEGGQAIVSDQSRCPFRAFANHRLRARQLESITNGLDARTRGTALHIALENFFSTITDSIQLRQRSTMEIQQVVSDSCDAAIDYLVRRRPELMTPQFTAIERHRLYRLLDEYMELEKQRRDFQVLKAEKSLSWQRRNLTINLKIDRIDRLDNHSLAIIDYKTGKYAPTISRLADQRPDNLQLPLYYCAVSEDCEESVGSVVISQITTGNVKFHGLSETDNFHRNVKPLSSRKEFDADWPTLTADWQSTVTELADEFIDGIARVSPANGKKTCETCRLQSLCRIRQLDPLRQYAGNDEEDHP